MAAAVRIVYVGHSTVLLEMDGVRLLTDPLLRTRMLHLRRVGPVDVEALQKPMPSSSLTCTSIISIFRRSCFSGEGPASSPLREPAASSGESASPT